MTRNPAQEPETAGSEDPGFRIREFAVADTEAVVSLWERCGLTRPWNDPRADISRKLSVQPELFLVAEEPGRAEPIGVVMAGYDGHRGWVHYLASDPEHRGGGVGSALLAEAEKRLLALGCPKVQLMVRPENDAVLDFYASRGYEPVETLVRGKRLIAD